ncbi:MAG: hypothetical protein IJJ64_07095 [Butyrivibrio sp.]|nr:hypothetical protein [Butyrivibrio sp.]
MKSNTKTAPMKGHSITFAEKNRVTGNKCNTKTTKKRGHIITFAEKNRITDN